MENIEDKDFHSLRLQLPASLSVMGTVTSLIGSAWPGAMMREHPGCLELLIPKVEPLPPSERAEAEPHDSTLDELGIDADLMGFQTDQDGQLSALVGTQGLEDAWNALAVYAFTVLTDADEKTEDPKFRDGVNYVSRQVASPAGDFEIIVCRSGRTPTDLRRAAEAELERYRQKYGPLD